MPGTGQTPKAGDVVQLKSGGPYMTVSHIDEGMGRTLAFCQWFIGEKEQSGNFPVASLRVEEDFQ